MATLRWCRFSSTDPFENLAREEAVFDAFSPEDIVLLFYVNASSIIVGKHQNPWREIDLPKARHRGVPVLRRITGGGTVFHDAGNHVFSFMRRRERLDREANLVVVREALEACGVPARLNGTYDLYAADRKISGNAFCFRKNRGIHHGTILVDADLEAMHGVLKRSEPSIETHAVASRPAPTVNVRDVVSGFDAEAFYRAVIDVSAKRFEASDVVAFDEREIGAEATSRLCERNTSWDWIFGRTPKFRVDMGRRDVEGLGDDRLIFGVHRGIVAEVESNDSERLESLVLGRRFERAELTDAFLGTGDEELVAANSLL